MRAWLISPVLVALSLNASAQVCRPTIPVARQHRQAMRRRTPSLDPPLTTTLQQVITWPAPVDATVPAVRDRDDPIDERETQAYVIAGSIRRITLERDDCDLHLELSVVGASATSARVVAEIPASPMFQAARDSILRALPASVRLLPGQPVDLTTPIPIAVTGFAFYDAYRAGRMDTRSPSHESPQVATLWGFHPVWAVVVAGQH